MAHALRRGKHKSLLEIQNKVKENYSSDTYYIHFIMNYCEQLNAKEKQGAINENAKSPEGQKQKKPKRSLVL